MEKMHNMETLKDIELKLTVEVGKKTELFARILKLREGDIIKLDKCIEDYIDIYLNGQKFATGEMVVVNNKFGVRIVDLS